MSYMKRHLLELQERNEQRIAERNKHAKQRMEQSGLFPQVALEDYKYELGRGINKSRLQDFVSHGANTGRLTGSRGALVIIDEVVADGTSRMQQELLNEDYSALELRVLGHMDQLPPIK
jgi:hypothetical protein